jgi:spore coat polysaccharide biosynthesis protein SpsF (cytidylyltransferase family)
VDQLVLEVKRKKEKEEAFRKYMTLYLQKRNNIMFIFQFVSPYIHLF